MNTERNTAIDQMMQIVDNLQYPRTLSARIRMAEMAEPNEVGDLILELAARSLDDLGFRPDQSKKILSAALTDFADFMEDAHLKMEHSVMRHQHGYAYDIVDKLVKRGNDVLREIENDQIPKILRGNYILPAKDVLFTLAAAKLMENSLTPIRVTNVLFKGIQDLGKQLYTA